MAIVYRCCLVRNTSICLCTHHQYAQSTPTIISHKAEQQIKLLFQIEHQSNRLFHIKVKREQHSNATMAAAAVAEGIRGMGGLQDNKHTYTRINTHEDEINNDANETLKYKIKDGTDIIVLNSSNKKKNTHMHTKHKKPFKYLKNTLSEWQRQFNNVICCANNKKSDVSRGRVLNFLTLKHKNCLIFGR
jgi:hypothetical protein